MSLLSAIGIQANGSGKELAGPISVTSDPRIFTRQDHEARVLDQRLNDAASDFYLKVTSPDDEIRGRAYDELSTQEPEVVSTAFIAVLQRTDGFDRREWGVEFVHAMTRAFKSAQKTGGAEKFCNSLAQHLLDTSLGIPKEITSELSIAALSHVQIRFSIVPEGAMYDLGLRVPEPGSLGVD